MTEDTSKTTICIWCGTPLSPTHTGPCPKCGKEGKKIERQFKEAFGARDSMNWEHRREFFEENRRIKWLIIAITFGSPFLGLILNGLLGLFIGLVFGIISFWLGPYAVVKVREINSGSS